MTDYDRESLDLQDEDRLPWLEAVDDADDEEGVSIIRLVLLIVAGLVFLGGVIGGIYWLQSDRSADGDGTLIAAPEGAYKIPAENPDARQFQGEGDTSFATSEGLEGGGKIDPGQLPETPVTEAAKPAPPPAPKSAAPAAPSAKVKAQVADNTKLVPTTSKTAQKPAAAGGAMIQLGAYGSHSGAEQAWTALSKRFDYLAEMGKSISPVDVNGATLYRLRAAATSNAQAKTLCGKLKVAGENCLVVPN
ncbi:SPOR domain-containing protein [Rhizorhapis sp. SPR117]|uniref:SPOR domain-containing protein n=1 Tax=Rhizorhapis sp. SPR117 TaxID=2912611 RepID=UPI001F36B28C|nr:SPOR domain-containing protein [Rhizorhapis sp. SPR117]